MRPEIRGTVRSSICVIVCFAVCWAATPLVCVPLAGQSETWSVYISADMEGLTGVGTPAMTSNGGKDYEVGRAMQTQDINAAIAGIRAAAAQRGIERVRIVVNDSHGDHANAYVELLAPGVEYVQGSLKPLGMVAGLDETFDAAMYIGYHSRAGTMGFLAHTGSGLVQHLEINGIPSGEGEMNAAFAGAHGVPVVLVHGDRDYVAQARETYARTAETVMSKTAITARAAHLRPIDDVRRELTEKARQAMLTLEDREPWLLDAPYTVELTLGSTTRIDVSMAVPGVERVSPTTLRFQSDDIRRAYALIRLFYRFINA
ncbi:M55 family metallopeptidase [Candidatus Palauibacter sp.]|uniref:M55 family metallopeptidase n=1 Tax=Candidatus Palauibacter sp. TaxID=3101350 RepID=UPI003AF2675C